jgi:HD-GYP domain-containing protein (c-di-GMP phosphodiesterase class II)
METAWTVSERRYQSLQRILAGLMVAFGLTAGGLIAMDPGLAGCTWWYVLWVCFLALLAASVCVCRKERQHRRIQHTLQSHVEATISDLNRRAQQRAASCPSPAQLLESISRLRIAYLGALESIARPLGGENSYDAIHGDQVALLAQRLATQMSLPAEVIGRLAEYAKFLDHGKFAIAAKILQKESTLEAWEWDIAKQHVELSVALLEPLEPDEQALAMIRHHHERWDGNGYPDGLKGDSMPVEARILAVADAYHAITSPRPFARARTSDEALAEIQAHSGTQFDPAVVAALKYLFAPRAAVASPA